MLKIKSILVSVAGPWGNGKLLNKWSWKEKIRGRGPIWMWLTCHCGLHYLPRKASTRGCRYFYGKESYWP